MADWATCADCVHYECLHERTTLTDGTVTIDMRSHVCCHDTGVRYTRREETWGSASHPPKACAGHCSG